MGQSPPIGTPPGGATKYHVTYTTDGGGSWHAPVDDHTNVPTNSLTFSADNSKTYMVGVRARQRPRLERLAQLTVGGALHSATHGYPDADRNPYANCHTDTNANGDTDGHGNTYPNTHTDRRRRTRRSREVSRSPTPGWCPGPWTARSSSR